MDKYALFSELLKMEPRLKIKKMRGFPRLGPIHLNSTIINVNFENDFRLGLSGSCEISIG